jgi:hypothetical protein
MGQRNRPSGRLVTLVAVMLMLTGCQSVTVSSVREPAPQARIERVLTDGLW